MSKRSIKKKQVAKKMRKLNKRRQNNRRKLKQNQDTSKQVNFQGQTPSENSDNSKDDVKEKFDFESIFTFIMHLFVFVFFLGMMGFLIYVTCFAWPDSSEEEETNISASSPITENAESNFQGENLTDSTASEPLPEDPEPAKTEPASEEDTEEPLPKLEAEFLFYDVTKHTTDELIAAASTLEFRQGPWPEGYNPYDHMNPDIVLSSDDPVEISKIYADLYNKDEWTGYPVERDGFRISYDRRGRMEVNGELTGVQINEGFYYDIAEELYNRGDWDGSPTKLGPHTISLSEDTGYLLVDDYLALAHQDCLDFPKECDIDIESSYAYLLGKGAYVLSNQSLVKLVKGEVITLSGGPLNFDGIDLSERTPFGFHLRYSKVYDKLLLYVYTCANEYYEKGLENVSLLDIPNEPRVFLYEFPDYNVSEVKFLFEVKASYWGSDDRGIYYKDTSDTCWALGESGLYELGHDPFH